MREARSDPITIERLARVAQAYADFLGAATTALAGLNLTLPPDSLTVRALSFAIAWRFRREVEGLPLREADFCSAFIQEFIYPPMPCEIALACDPLDLEHLQEDHP